MQADFARITFDAVKHYSRVLYQQGRVQLEADANEQVAILLHFWRAAIKDIVGPYAGPQANCGFGIITPSLKEAQDAEKEQVKALFDGRDRDLVIGPGHYYVDGFLCENDDYVLYSDQPDAKGLGGLDPAKDLPCIVYLDVFERAVSASEDADIREVALGVDTTARAKVAWVVRTEKISQVPDHGNLTGMKPTWDELVDKWQPKNRALMRARAGQRNDDEEYAPCIVSPHARYRRPENQLYRVEIHGTDPGGRPTFKLSRENATVVYPIEKVTETTITLGHLGRDARSGLVNGDWVEIVDDAAPPEAPRTLLKVTDVDLAGRTITVEQGDAAAAAEPGQGSSKSRYLRRWDQRRRERGKNGLELHQGAAVIPNEKDWIALEDGIEIQFQAAGTGTPQYRPGDYWLIPARVATGDVEWQKDGNKPRAVAPHGVTHHYAPLAALKANKLEVVRSLRPKFERLPTTF